MSQRMERLGSNDDDNEDDDKNLLRVNVERLTINGLMMIVE